jgi:hypothetical protein
MNIKRITLLFSTSLLSLLFSCSDQSNLPKSLEGILKRQGTSNSGGVGTGTGSSSTSTSYSGSYASDVSLLLSRVSGWKTNSCLTCNDGIPPTVKIGTNCVRDTYVAAAVNYAWAAESYARLGKSTDASSMAVRMNTELQRARALCSNGPVFGGSSGITCQTLSIYSC